MVFYQELYQDARSTKYKTIVLRVPVQHRCNKISAEYRNYRHADGHF